MKISFIISGVVFLLCIVELEGTYISEFLCPQRNLSVTVDDTMWLYIDGIEITGLPNADIWDKSDVVELPCTAKLIAIHGRNRDAGVHAGILASTDDDYILTNSTWKCSNISHSGWEEIDFDDSAWTFADDLRLNGEDNWKFINGISANASWIWLRYGSSAVSERDLDVYCRKRMALSFCLSSPCAFGGTCIQEPNGGYQCICAPGYTGQNCTSVIDYCESDPCANGGSCLPVVNGYVCQCQSGYTDHNCDDVINNCESFPCLNGGTCLNGINYYACACPAEWTGVRCDILLNPCDGLQCPNGGTCLNYCGDLKCVCAPGWTGNLCISHIEPCASNPCQNDGSCQAVENGYICTCPPYFTGHNCDEIIDLCASHPCLNGGTCVFDCGVQQCFCPNETTGQNCQSLFKLLPVVELEVASVSPFSCVKRNLSATVDNEMKLYIDGVQITGLHNFNNWTLLDVVDLPCTTRLIAIDGRNYNVGAGIVVSTGDDYVLTNSTWKCSNVSHVGWEEIDFDDSSWMPAVETSLSSVPGISSNAEWIWLRQYNTSEDLMDMNVYCRKRLDPNYCTTISPCLFGAICIDEPNGEYHCNCTPGYTGKNCSSEINYCESDPCGSGGSCLPIFNGYVCQCLPGYTGDHCEDVINNCESFPCLNGGTCLNGIDYYVCTCPPEWTGVRCDTLINYCESDPCGSGGSCLPIVNGYVCQCLPGYTGEHCEYVINTCDPNPCLNGGSCSNQGGSPPTCTCPIFATGVKCESPNYDESLACGTTLDWSEYDASNDFTRLCYFWAPLDDIEGRSTQCRNTINGIPLYDDYVGLLNSGGNFGCLVTQNYPEDLPEASRVACADNYQQDVSLGNYSATDRMMVCIRYPYEGIPGRK